MTNITKLIQSICKDFDENYYDEGQFEADVHDRQRRFIMRTIQSCYEAGMNNPKEINIKTNHLKTLMFGIKLGRLIGVGLSIDKFLENK